MRKLINRTVIENVRDGDFHSSSQYLSDLSVSFRANCTSCDAGQAKTQTVNDGIFFRFAIVALASATLYKSPLLVEPTRRQVRLPDFEENRVRASVSSQVKKFFEQT